jgi:cob(I)alamin adenosyltransferase
MAKRKGFVHVYTGDGKGKTTTAVGLALRANGHGMRVLMIQFLKGGGHAGELVAANEHLPNFTIKQYGKPCPYSEALRAGEFDCGNCKDCFLSRKEERDKVKEGVEHAEKALKSPRYDMVILDEINNAVSAKIIPISRVTKLIKNKRQPTELVLTGRNAAKEIIDLADYVTVMKKSKHPFTRGYRSRYGIDF